MATRLRKDSHQQASASKPAAWRVTPGRRARPAKAVLQSLAVSPYRDAAAATFAAVGSLVLVKSLEQLAATGVLEGVRLSLRALECSSSLFCDVLLKCCSGTSKQCMASALSSATRDRM